MLNNKIKHASFLSTAGLKWDSQAIENYTTLKNKYAGNEANCGNAISTTITSEHVYEVGEISVEGPAFSLLTPKV